MHDLVVQASDYFVKLASAAEAVVKLSSATIREPYRTVLKTAQMARLFKVPAIAKRVGRSSDYTELTHNLISLYGCLFALRKAADWIPAWEMPIGVSILGLASIDLFRRALNKSARSYSAYTPGARLEARYMTWEAGLSMAATLALGARVFFPLSREAVIAHSCLKLANLTFPFLRF